MGTRTTVIFKGRAHPNQDGFGGRDLPGSFWLWEGARYLWSTGSGNGFGRGSWVCRHPSNMLLDGLLLAMRGEMVGRAYQENRPEIADLVETRRLHLGELADGTYSELHALLKRVLHDWPGKFGICAFQGSSIASQFCQLRSFDCEIEILEPSGTRLKNRWFDCVQRTGILAEDD